MKPRQTLKILIGNGSVLRKALQGRGQANEKEGPRVTTSVPAVGKTAQTSEDGDALVLPAVNSDEWK